MSVDRWHRIEEIVLDALARREHEREAFVRTACAGDAALRDEVESLLGFETAAAPFLERAALQEAAATLSAEGASTLVHRELGGFLRRGGFCRQMRRCGETARHR